MAEDPRSKADWLRYGALVQLGSEMVAPIALGLFLDFQLETMPWLTVIGAVLGFGLGMMHLLMVVRARNGGPPHDRPRDSP